MKERVNGEIKEVSGSDSSNEGESSSIEYLDLTNIPTTIGSWILHLVMASLFVKQYVTLGGVTINAVFPTFMSQEMRGDLLGVNQFAIDFKATMAMSGDGMVQTMTVADYLILQGATQEELDAIPRITKEQFYSLE